MPPHAATRESRHAPEVGPAVAVLLVEDSAADAELARLALAGRARLGALYIARDGESALALLKDAEGGARPDLVLLDLNLPGLDGCGVLAEIRLDPVYRDLPVVVLTSSASRADVSAAYRAGASCYVTKPVTLDRYMATLHAIADFWLGVATLPPRP